MEFPKDRRIVVGAAAAAGLIVVVALGFVIGAGRKDADAPAAQAKGGLVLDITQDDVKLDPARKLACYVGGQSIGMTTLAECATRNGIESGQLDVGITQSGEMAFGELGAALTPLPPEPVAAAPAAAAVEPLATTAQPIPLETKALTAPCWRYADRTWVKTADLTLGACVASLFDGRCERPGGAMYGRWGDRTLRLTPGRVEQSFDNRGFSTLVEQSANCALPPL